jgi:hypothetical protein
LERRKASFCKELFVGELGARMNYFGAVFGLEVSAFARAAYARYFTRETNVSAALAGLPAAGFTLNAGETDMIAAILSGSFDVKVTERASIGLQIEAELSQNEVQLVSAVRVRFAF